MKILFGVLGDWSGFVTYLLLQVFSVFRIFAPKFYNLCHSRMLHMIVMSFRAFFQKLRNYKSTQRKEQEPSQTHKAPNKIFHM